MMTAAPQGAYDAIEGLGAQDGAQVEMAPASLHSARLGGHFVRR